MSLLLANATAELYPPDGADSHGWALPGAVASWAGPASWQPAPGRSAADAADSGGHGPHAPAAVAVGQLYLPPEAPVADGVLAVVGGARLLLSQTRLVGDPRGHGDLDCWVATATEAPDDA